MASAQCCLSKSSAKSRSLTYSVVVINSIVFTPTVGPAHPLTLPRVTISITRSDPDGDEWDGKEVSDPRITRPIQKWLRTGRGRKCEHVKDFLWERK